MGVRGVPCCSAFSAGLSAQAARLYQHLSAHPDLDPIDVAHSLATTRSHHPTAPPSPPALSTTAKTTATQPMRWPHCTPWPTTAHPR
ncbi:hypothetical protein OIO89_01090 (plasmid) [Mycobacterium ulcerans]|nr:hypothetical protein OIO89_01090 [Mycobacterium ulcerans]